jgi:hypothetical protein
MEANETRHASHQNDHVPLARLATTRLQSSRRKSKWLRWSAGLWLAFFLRGPASATCPDELLASGYSVWDVTRLPGFFSGCVRNRTLVFADGSTFVCSETRGQLGLNLRVLILGRPGEAASVTLAGSRVLPGTLLRLRNRTYARPQRAMARPTVSHHSLEPLGGLTRALPGGAATTPVKSLPQTPAANIDQGTRR